MKPLRTRRFLQDYQREVQDLLRDIADWIGYPALIRIKSRESFENGLVIPVTNDDVAFDRTVDFLRRLEKATLSVRERFQDEELVVSAVETTEGEVACFCVHAIRTTQHQAAK